MKRIIFFLSLIAILAACSIDNTMYNARMYFKSAQARPLNANGRVSPQAVADYTKAIEKCGIILTERRDSPDADDALYLMARALYYKGNSAFQAKDQFENLIKAFPNSPFVPEAHIYLARVLREISRPREAELQLEEFIRNPEYKKQHPRALLVLADFEIQDGDYYRAQFWLEKLLVDYTGTPEYNEAFFLFGKNYYVQKNYDQSRIQFEKLINSRGVSKEIKLEANYYLALCHYHLQNYERGYRILRSLINSEYRPERIAMIRVLRARLQFALGDEADAISELEFINKTYARTAASAEAFYYRAEYQYYVQNDITSAIASYNRVRSEFANSDLAATAQLKSAALTQLNQGKNLNSKSNLQQFLDYHFLAAENFVSPLALPDSTIAYYQKILKEELRFAAIKDSLYTKISALQTRIDSLSLLIPQDAVIDSLDNEGAILPIEDSKKTDLTMPDSLFIEPLDQEHQIPEVDSVQYIDQHTEESMDAYEYEDLIEVLHTDIDPDSEPDSLVTSITGEVVDNNTAAASIQQIQAQIRDLQTQIKPLQSSLDNVEGILSRFDTEIIPFTYFVKASHYKRMGESEAELDSILTLMQERYPDHKYTTATRLLTQNLPVRLIDPYQEAQEMKLDYALGLTAEPDSMRTALTTLSNSDLPFIALRAKFRLGWFYTFEEVDTTAAKIYLDEVINSSDSGDYGVLVRRFYNGRKFLFTQITATIDSLIAEVDSLLIIKEHDVSDSLTIEDSLEDSKGDVLPDLDSGQEHPPVYTPRDILNEDESSPEQIPPSPEIIVDPEKGSDIHLE